MEKINLYNPRIPYFIMYRNGGWVFYNREYKNLLTGDPESTDDPKQIYNIPTAVLSQLSKDFNPATSPKEYQRVYLHDNPNMVGQQKKSYIKNLLLLLHHNIDPLNIKSKANIQEGLSEESAIKRIEAFLIEI